MAGAAKKYATYEDLLTVPDTLVAEIIHGVLVTSPRPAVPHAVATSTLGIDLGSAFQRGRGGPGGWWILDEPEIHLGRDVLVPDLAGWRVERMPTPPKTAALELPPDWVCEVLSPSTEKLDRADKLDIYANATVRYAWLVNPLLQTLEGLRLEDKRWLRIATHAGSARVRAEPFDAIELELFALWGEAAPSEP
jgi:Uma2 family endonuclease